MQSSTEVQARLEKAQNEFNMVMAQISGMRMSPKAWDKFFDLMYRAELKDVDLSAVSKVTMFNYENWKKRNNK